MKGQPICSTPQISRRPLGTEHPPKGFATPPMNTRTPATDPLYGEWFEDPCEAERQSRCNPPTILFLGRGRVLPQSETEGHPSVCETE